MMIDCRAFVPEVFLQPYSLLYVLGTNYILFSKFLDTVNLYILSITFYLIVGL